MLRSFFLILFAGLLMAAGSAASAADKAPLRIAFIDPMSGSLAASGLDPLAQIRFDAARFNEQGGINGHKVEIVAFDNKVDPQLSLVHLQKAMDEGISYIIQGNGSSVASAIINAVKKHNLRNPDQPVLFLNRAAVDPTFTNERCNFWHFRFDANAAMKMNILTNWVEKKKDIHKVFLLNPDYSFGHAVSKAARKMLQEKRPDIEVVGNVFVPLGKVKDFSPYVSQIRTSGADAVITGNWGQDFTLLIKSAASYGLKMPFLTYYGNSPGTVKQIGEAGVGLIYVVADYSGDFTDAEMAKRKAKMYQETGWDLIFLRVTDMMEMLKLAMEKADSIEPTDVAFALEGLHYDSPTGTVFMRKKDHQIQMPMFITVLQDDMEHGADDTDLNFHAIDKFTAEQGEMPTTCKMQRPDRS